VSEHWLDQFLGDPVGEATRLEVLQALRGHVLGTVVIEEELPDGTSAWHVRGTLVEASRDPAGWEDAEHFAVVTGLAAGAWHNVDPVWEEAAATIPQLRANLDAAKEPPLFTFGVPQAGMIEYPGPDAGSSGYRWPLDGGRTLAVVLWQDVLHVTPSGDLAPGLGGFTVEVEPEES
jgi:hypothetical protein